MYSFYYYNTPKTIKFILRMWADKSQWILMRLPNQCFFASVSPAHRHMEHEHVAGNLHEHTQTRQKWMSPQTCTAAVALGYAALLWIIHTGGPPWWSSMVDENEMCPFSRKWCRKHRVLFWHHLPLKRHPSITSSLDYLHVYSIYVAQSNRGRDEGRGGQKEGEA